MAAPRSRRLASGGGWLGSGLDAAEELWHVVNALNGKNLFSIQEGEEFGDYDKRLREAPPLLRRMVETWEQSGRNLANIHREWPTLWRDLEIYFKAAPVELDFPPSGGAGLWHSFFDRPGGTSYQEALRFFLLLILNPMWSRLGGPCAKCGDYYVKGAARNRKYCSRPCATGATAIVATRKHREEERAEKLRIVDRLVDEWRIRNPKKDWKHWISEGNPEITVHWLTRAANRGDLKPPMRNQHLHRIK